MTQEHSYDLLMESFDPAVRPTIQRVRHDINGEEQLAASMMRWVGELFVNGGYDTIRAQETLPQLFDQLNALEKIVNFTQSHPSGPVSLDNEELSALQAVLQEKTDSFETEQKALNVWCTAQVISELTADDLSSDEQLRLPSFLNDDGDMIPMTARQMIIHHVEHYHCPDNPYNLPIITFTGKVVK